MRHLRRTAKLGRQFEHRNAMLANMVCSLIKHKRVTTTLAKAKAADAVLFGAVLLTIGHFLMAFEGQEAVARTARSVLPLAEKANDQPTLDLLTQRLDIHEKNAWMLRSLLKK